MSGALTAVKRWLTYRLVQIASQLDGEMFMRLCEVAVVAHHMEEIEIIRDAMRLEQEHYYDNHERETDDTDINATNARNKHKLH